MPRAMTLSQPKAHCVSTCHRHPTTKPITGFCASCLRERLEGIENQSPSSSSAPAAFQLRRTKSYSGVNAEEDSAADQPRRRSCDVRAKSTLHDLFSVDDERRKNPKRKSRVSDLGLDLKEEEEGEGEEENQKEEIGSFDRSRRRFVVEYFEDGAELKTMKEFIDLEWGNRNKKITGRDFKEIASVLSKKLRRWTQKQKNKKKREVPNVDFVDTKLLGRRLRETQSEVGEYGLGRRSCDTDPRLSIDAGRVSVEDSHYSFDEPRASWDGCLISKNNPRHTPMASVVEDVKVSPVNGGVDDDEEDERPGGSAQTRDYYADPFSLQRRRRSFDRSSSVKRAGLLELDEMKAISNAKVSPETVGLFHGAKLLVTEKELRDSNWYSLKDCVSESVESASKGVGHVDGEVSQKRFSLRKSGRWRNVWNIWGLMHWRSKCGDDEEKCVGGKVVEGSLAESLLKLRRVANGEANGAVSQKHVGGNVVEGSLAESLQKLRRVANGEVNGTVSQKLIRSYSVSARNSSDGLFHGMSGIEGFARNSCDGLYHGVIGVEVKDDGLKRKDNLLLQRNRSARYSPTNLDNGLLRFYLTPLRSYRRSKSGKSRLKNSTSQLL